MMIDYISFINMISEDIIIEYNIPTPITNIAWAVNALGGDIIVSNKMLDTDIVKSGESFSIIVSESCRDINFPYTKYSIAACLGHLFLHMGYMIRPDWWEQQENKRVYRSQTVEGQWDANSFGRALLMPKVGYVEKFREFGGYEGAGRAMKQIAEYFDVPESAAVKRGEELGIIETNF